MSRSNEKNQSSFSKRSPNHDEPSAPKVKGEGGRNSQGGKTICVTCRKKHFGKCLVGIENCLGCREDGHKMRDFPNVQLEGMKLKIYS